MQKEMTEAINKATADHELRMRQLQDRVDAMERSVNEVVAKNKEVEQRMRKEKSRMEAALNTKIAQYDEDMTARHATLKEINGFAIEAALKEHFDKIDADIGRNDEEEHNNVKMEAVHKEVTEAINKATADHELRMRQLQDRVDAMERSVNEVVAKNKEEEQRMRKEKNQLRTREVMYTSRASTIWLMLSIWIALCCSQVHSFFINRDDFTLRDANNNICPVSNGYNVHPITQSGTIFVQSYFGNFSDHMIETMIDTGCEMTFVPDTYAASSPSAFLCHPNLIRGLYGVRDPTKAHYVWACYATNVIPTFVDPTTVHSVVSVPSRADATNFRNHAILGVDAQRAAKLELSFRCNMLSMEAGHFVVDDARMQKAMQLLGLSHHDLVPYDKLPHSIEGRVDQILAAGNVSAILATYSNALGSLLEYI